MPAVETAALADLEIKEPLPRGYERILFVDDEEYIVDLGRQMLERLGYRVWTQTSSSEALAQFRRDPGQFDLVISDLTMPKITGDRLAGELMALRPDLPIILCTGYSEWFSKDKASAMGISGIIMKPVSFHALAKTVRRALDRRPIAP